MSPGEPRETFHLRPSAPVAPDALLPGDPGRALALAQQLLTKPTMSNHSRGLWGYSGETEAGDALTIQATGMGGPSAAIVLTELAALGVRRAIRVGTCGGLDRGLELGRLLVATASVAADGTSVSLGADGVVEADAELTEALEAGGAEPHTVATTDLFYEVEPGRAHDWIERGAAAVEMEAATLFALGPREGIAVACLLVVTDTFGGGVPGEGEHARIDDDTLAEAVERMGRVAAAALATR